MTLPAATTGGEDASLRTVVDICNSFMQQQSQLMVNIYDRLGHIQQRLTDRKQDYSNPGLQEAPSTTLPLAHAVSRPDICAKEPEKSNGFSQPVSSDPLTERSPKTVQEEQPAPSLNEMFKKFEKKLLRQIAALRRDVVAETTAIKTLSDSIHQYFPLRDPSRFESSGSKVEDQESQKPEDSEALRDPSFPEVAAYHPFEHRQDANNSDGFSSDLGTTHQDRNNEQYRKRSVLQLRTQRTHSLTLKPAKKTDNIAMELREMLHTEIARFRQDISELMNDALSNVMKQHDNPLVTPPVNPFLTENMTDYVYLKRKDDNDDDDEDDDDRDCYYDDDNDDDDDCPSDTTVNTELRKTFRGALENNIRLGALLEQYLQLVEPQA